MRLTGEDLRHRLLPIVCAQAVGLACGIAGVSLVSRFVEPADYGAYGVFMTLATMGAGVVYVGLVKFISRHWQTAADRAGLLREILAAMARKTPWLLALCVGASLFVAPERIGVYAALLFVSALLVTLAQFAQSALQAAREHWRDLGVSAGISVTRSFGPPLLYAATGAGLVALLIGFVLQALVGTVLGFVNLRRWIPATLPVRGKPTLTSVYEGPRFIALAAAGWILVGVNRWIVAWLFGAEQAGYFTLAVNVGAILPQMAGLVFLQYMQPQWFAADAIVRGARRALLADVDRVAMAYTVVALLLAAAVHAVVPSLSGTLISARYAEAAAFVFPAGAATAAVTIGLYYHAMLLAAKRERDCAAVDLGGAACLITGALVSAAAGLGWFKAWLTISPLVPWLVNRTLARRALFRGA